MSPVGLVFAGQAVAGPVIKEIVTKAFRHLGGYFSAESMEEMKNTLERGLPKIQAVLDVVSPDQIKDKSKALDAWFWKLRDAVEAAEDAIDELEYYELEEKAKDHKVSDWGSPLAKTKHKVVRSVKHVSILDKTVKQFTHRGTLKRLKQAMEGLDKAAAEISTILELTNFLEGDLTNNYRETGSMLCAPKFVGREAEKKKITEWLNKTASAKEVEIVPSTCHVPILSIVGSGGMGKTTLVQSILKHDVVKNFEQVAWATVSTSFDAISVISKILESATRTPPSAKHLDALQKELQEKLGRGKFLVILDDVWEEKKINEWEKLFAPLKSGKSGSKILLTTRMPSVAEVAANVMGVGRDFVELEKLKEDENLELFNYHVFFGLNSQNYNHLKSIGEQIARKLGGCPLVTKVVSAYLQGNMTSGHWENFLHKGLEHFVGTEDDIMSVLRLSYYHLPIELRICFRYCSLFPEDYRFEKKKLVKMWMGSGLISRETSGSLTFEEIGEQILAQLTRKSFYEKTSSLGGEQEHYVMHDYMHDLARNVSSGECARINDPAELEKENDTVRHLSVSCISNFSVDEVKKISYFKNLRSIIIGYSKLEVDKDMMIVTLEKVVQSLKSLRLFYSELRTASCSADMFGNLIHLRYINVNQISPEGICGVVKLYHLMILHCYMGLQRETKQVRYLGNLEGLRYVSYGVDGWRSKQRMWTSRGHGLGEFPVSRLTSLQELNNYRVQGRIGNNISAIRSLRNLRMLELRGLENVLNHEEAKNAMLKEKQYLDSLHLEWEQTAHNGAERRTDNLVLDHLEPHGNISALEIRGYEGLKLPFWIENLSVKKLVSLRLVSCINWEYIPSLGELALLKHLWLEDLFMLQEIGPSSQICSSSSTELLLPPRLVTVNVIGCPKLKELPLQPGSLVSLKLDGIGLTTFAMIGEISRESIDTKPCQLKYIRIVDCPCLTSLEGSLLEQKVYMASVSMLTIRDCLELESASIPFEEMNELREVRITNCPKLRTMRGAKDKLLPPTIRELEMGNCGDVGPALLGSGLRCLHRLVFDNCSGLGCLHRLVFDNCSGLGCLHWLVFDNCSGLGCLPSADVFKTLKSLTRIDIRGCENISSLGGLGSLPVLKHLEIRGCSKLAEAGSSGDDYIDINYRNFFRSLQIDYIDIDQESLLLVEPLKSLNHTQTFVIKDAQMKSLPERWLRQNRLALQHLLILGAASLQSVPSMIRDLSSLETLWLHGAEQLQSLPDLPSSLNDVEVTGSELKKRTIENGSPEWNKISHIAKLKIGSSCFIMGKKCSEETYNRLRWRLSDELTTWANQQKDDKGLHYWKKQFCLQNAS